MNDVITIYNLRQAENEAVLWPGSLLPGTAGLETVAATYMAIRMRFVHGRGSVSVAPRMVGLSPQSIAKSSAAGRAANVLLDAVDSPSQSAHWVHSDGVKPRNRVRSYKGLMNLRQRRDLDSYQQAEVETPHGGTIIVASAKMQRDPSHDLNLLMDMFQSFILVGASDHVVSMQLLEQLGTCFKQSPVFRWIPELVYRHVLNGDRSLFFFKSVVSAAVLELVAYVPLGKVNKLVSFARNHGLCESVT